MTSLNYLLLIVVFIIIILFYFFFKFDRTPPGAASGLYGQSQAQSYDMSLANHGPRTRPPSNPAVHPNPYDDPYYSYGGLESGTSQGLSLDAPRGTTQGNRVPGARLDAGATGGGRECLLS